MTFPATDYATELAGLHADLRELGATVAIAESLTGGLLTAALTATPGASATVRGVLIVYATDLKATIAGVPADLLAERGAVDPDVVLALARGVRTRLDATYGLGVTSVAGPDPQDGKPVGTVFLAIAGPDDQTVAERAFIGGRAAIRAAAVDAALDVLKRECASAITSLRSL